MSRRRPRPILAFTLLAASVALAIALALAVWWRVSLPWAYLAGINFATVGAYLYDKSVSGGRTSRVPERVLHFLAAAGGSPGAFLAQRFFRHKTLKRPFQIRFW